MELSVPLKSNRFAISRDAWSMTFRTSCMSTCETTSKLGMAAMLGALGSVSERPKEAVCKTAAEATVVRTHPGPLQVKAQIRRNLRPGPSSLRQTDGNEPAVDDRHRLEPGGGAPGGAGHDPVGGPAGEAADDRSEERRGGNEWR